MPAGTCGLTKPYNRYSRPPHVYMPMHNLRPLNAEPRLMYSAAKMPYHLHPNSAPCFRLAVVSTYCVVSPVNLLMQNKCRRFHTHHFMSLGGFALRIGRCCGDRGRYRRRGLVFLTTPEQATSARCCGSSTRCARRGIYALPKEIVMGTGGCRSGRRSSCS
jgi:hypothetical protein